MVYVPGIAICSSPRATSSCAIVTLRDQQRPAVPPERAAGIEQHVIADAVRVRVETQFGDIDLAGKRRVVERLDVGHAHGEFKTFEIDAPMHDRIEHETVVRAG